MKKLVALAVLIIAVVAFSAQSQKPKATGTSGKAGGDAAMLLDIENNWNDAAMKKDVAWMDKVYADDLTDVAPDGTVTTKQEDRSRR